MNRFRIAQAPSPKEEEDDASASLAPSSSAALILPRASSEIRHASPNTSDPFEAAGHLCALVISGLTALGSLLILKQRR